MGNLIGAGQVLERVRGRAPQIDVGHAEVLPIAPGKFKIKVQEK
jgi:hypothetical protein